jgi:ribosomal protein S18 acetylase RimI-like enzyme
MSEQSPSIRIEPAGCEHLPAITALAGVIWRAVYPGIISSEQIEYMLARMYAVEELARQIGQGTGFLRLLNGGELIGFAAHSPTSNPAERKLDKLYLHPDYQRRGHGSRLLNHAMDAARALGCTSLMLTVNRRNTKAIAAYEKNGFMIRESIVADIGGGFVMDDHVMVRAL